MSLNVNDKSVGTVSFPTTGDWTTYSEAKIDVSLKAGVNTLKLSSMTSDGGPNVDMFTFGIDGVELYDGTQKINNPTMMPVGSFKSGVVFDPATGVLFTPKAGFAEVYFFDMSGALRMGVSQNVVAGTSVFALDRNVLPKGKYLVKVMLNGKAVSVKKFSKQ